MRRRLFDLAAAVSLLLCVGVGVLWVRSHRVTDHLTDGPSGQSDDGKIWYRSAVLRTSQGELGFCVRSTSLSPTELGHFGIRPSDLGSPPEHDADPITGQFRWGAPDGCTRDIRFGSFQFGVTGAVPNRGAQFFQHGVFVVIPLWLVVMLLSIVPAAAGRRWWWMRRAARRRGYCGVCGYDMRATPDQCPECGTGAAAPA